MQLSPRQYQADPTGAAYVQDTRPLMAAMGAQAATQIEGNRMMTETMQKGMQGIENFAARRQLAAARAQLGTLDLEDPDYGQKLAGLVLDNPLAFTNAKTAPLADMAFKQASNTYLAKEKNKADIASRYQDYLYSRNLAGMKMRGDVSLASKQNARFAADVFRTEAAPIKEALGKLELARINATPDELAYIDQQTSALQNQLTESESKYRGILSESTSTAPVDFGPAIPLPEGAAEDFTSAPTAAGSAGNGPEFPVVGVGEGASFLDLAPGVQDRGSFGPAPRAQAVPETEVVIPEMVPSGAPFGPETPAAPAAPTSAAVSPTAAQIEAGRLSLSKRLGPKTSAARPENIPEKEMEALVSLNSDVIEAKVKAEEIDAKLKIAEDKVADLVEVGADELIVNQAKIDRDNLRIEKGMVKIARDTTEARARAEIGLSEAGQKAVQQSLDRQAAAQPPAPENIPTDPTTVPTESQAAAFRAAVGLAAGPATILEKRIREKNQEPLRVVEETNQQWTGAKSKIVDTVGGQAKLDNLVFDVLQNPLVMSSVLPEGVRRDAQVAQIKEQISKLIPADVMRKDFGGKAFDQKAERDGPQGVSWDNVLTALADEMLTKYAAAYSNVMNPPAATAAPAAFKPSSGATGTTQP